MLLSINITYKEIKIGSPGVKKSYYLYVVSTNIYVIQKQMHSILFALKFDDIILKKYLKEFP